MRRFVSLAALALALLVGASGADAQDFRGAITGRITDGQGGRLPGATVTVVHVATNVVTTTTTDSDGGYSFSYLAPGAYKVTAELSGFKKARARASRCGLAIVSSLPCQLEVGQLRGNGLGRG